MQSVAPEPELIVDTHTQRMKLRLALVLADFLWFLGCYLTLTGCMHEPRRKRLGDDQLQSMRVHCLHGLPQGGAVMPSVSQGLQHVSCRITNLT